MKVEDKYSLIMGWCRGSIMRNVIGDGHWVNKRAVRIAIDTFGYDIGGGRKVTLEHKFSSPKYELVKPAERRYSIDEKNNWKLLGKDIVLREDVF